VIDPDRITIQDIRDAGYCASGARRWFSEQGLDFRDFMQNGILIADFLATNDGMAALVVTRKLERDARG
jgi:hypothetical protein